MTGLLASMQATHQKKMFESCGLDIQSQAAFELASRGLIRPTDRKIPLVYGIKCVEFKKPYFKLEIHAINETEAYLGLLVHEIGINLRSSAHCTKLKCIRHGCFTIADSLLRRHWDLTNIVANMAHNRRLLQLHPDLLRQSHAELVESK
jgi:mitochondrial mRNA pseudouridine synthase TRUB2